jgi:hypothetical protein
MCVSWESGKSRKSGRSGKSKEVFENLNRPPDPLHPCSECVKHPPVQNFPGQKKHAWDSGTWDKERQSIIINTEVSKNCLVENRMEEC